MAYEPEHGRLLPLVPLGVASIVCTVIVVADLAQTDASVAGDIGPAALGIWLLVMGVQGAANVWISLVARILDDRGVEPLVQVNVVVGLFAATGAATFWWADPLKGAICGLVASAGLLVSSHLRALSRG